jgi:hypothetical protein
MHPAFSEMMLRDNERELRRNVRYAHVSQGLEQATALQAEPVALRLSRAQDDVALDRLAQLDSRPTPTGPHVVAEIGGAIVAALPLGSGPALADPFRRTDNLIPLLELRANQLAAHRLRRHSLAVLRAAWSWSRA